MRGLRTMPCMAEHATEACPANWRSPVRLRRWGPTDRRHDRCTDLPLTRRGDRERAARSTDAAAGAVLAPIKHWPAARSSAPGGLDWPRPAGPVVRGSAHRDRDIDRGEHPPVRTTTGTRRLVRAPRTHQLSASAQPMITIRWATSAELLDRRDQPRPAISTRVSGARGFPLTSSGVTGTARSVDRITDVETRNTPE